MHYDESMQRYVLDLPQKCELCGSKLELDIWPNETYLRCTKQGCDFQEDVTAEFEKTSKANEEEDSLEGEE